MDQLRIIVPKNEDRSLKAVVKRALKLSAEEANLGPNWDLNKITKRIRQERFSAPDFELPELVVRDAKQGDGWYLQDGNHRALGYAMMVCSKEAEYAPQGVYCATNRQLL